MFTNENSSKVESTRFEISKLIFLTVREALEHEQRSNTPMLMGMAFLTAAGSAIFAAVYSRIWHQSSCDLITPHLHPVVISFAIFIILILLGTSFSVSAQRSKLHLPPANKGEPPPANKGEPPSLFFWRAIDKFPRAKWLKYLAEIEEDKLTILSSKHLTLEAHLMSRLVAHKHRQRGRASFCFLFALVFFAIFLGFALNDVFYWGVVWAIVFGLVVSLALVWCIR